MSIRVASRNTHHIITIFLAHIRIGIYKSYAHSLSVVFIGTKNDCFSHSVSMLEVMSNLFSYFPNAVFYNNLIVVVRIIINAVFYFIAINIYLPHSRPPLITNVSGNIYNSKRS